jgi:NodT family efflux transporter outer membrane factor (OMF) lipoprotein
VVGFLDREHGEIVEVPHHPSTTLRVAPLPSKAGEDLGCVKIGVAFLALALAGCTVGPNFERPAAPPTTAGYRAPDDATVPNPATPNPAAPQPTLGAAPTRAWWKAFASPALDTLVDRAIANNPSLAASNATLARARAQIAAVAGRGLPQLDADARVEREQVNLAAFGFDGVSVPGAAIDNPTFDLYTVGGGVSYDLDLFGANRRRVEQARAQAEAQLRQTEAAHLTIAGRVVTQVLTIAAIRARIATAEHLLDEDRHLVDLTDARRRAGDGTMVEVLNVQAQLANDRGDLPQLRQQLDEARHMLATLIGVAPADLGPTDYDLAGFALPASVPVALPSQLVRNRPDILQAEADLHAATAAVGIATAQLYPDISIGATISYAAPGAGDLFSSGFRGFDIVSGLTAPIFHGGTLKAQRQAAVETARASAATYRQTVLASFQQVADLVAALQSDQRSVANQQDAVDIAGRSRDLSQRSFTVGNTGILTVLDAERLYQRARLALVDARARQYLDIARLYVATAGGWTGPA